MVAYAVDACANPSGPRLLLRSRDDAAEGDWSCGPRGHLRTMGMRRPCADGTSEGGNDMSILDTLKALIRHGAREQAVQRIVTHLPPERAGGVGGNPLTPNECYMKISLTRMRNRDKRVLTKDYYPTLHSFVTMSVAGGVAELPVVASPDKLAELDPGNVDRAQQRVFVLCPVTPYIGGDVGLAAGLFAVKERDLLKDFLDVLGAMSGVVAGAEIKAALGVIEPLKGGMEKILNLEDTPLLIGLVTTLLEQPDGGTIEDPTDIVEHLRDGYYAVVSRADDPIVASQLELHDGQLQLGGAPIEDDYFIVHVEQLPEFEDWAKIADLDEAAANVLEAAAKEGLDAKEYKEAFTELRVAVIHAHRSLIHSDQVRILTGIQAQAEDFARTGPPIEALAGRQPGKTIADAVQRAPSIQQARTMPIPP